MSGFSETTMRERLQVGKTILVKENILIIHLFKEAFKCFSFNPNAFDVDSPSPEETCGSHSRHLAQSM
jgi:hypothetical protein